MNMSHELIALIVFAVLGFIVGYLLLRAAGIMFFGIFLYAALILLHFAKIRVDWGVLNATVAALTTAGRSFYQLTTGLLSAASAMHLVFFLGGGLIGLVSGSGRR